MSKKIFKFKKASDKIAELRFSYADKRWIDGERRTVIIPATLEVRTDMRHETRVTIYVGDTGYTATQEYAHALVGRSFCNPEDEFALHTGVLLAAARACGRGWDSMSLDGNNASVSKTWTNKVWAAARIAIKEALGIAAYDNVSLRPVLEN